LLPQCRTCGRAFMPGTSYKEHTIPNDKFTVYLWPIPAEMTLCRTRATPRSRAYYIPPIEGEDSQSGYWVVPRRLYTRCLTDSEMVSRGFERYGALWASPSTVRLLDKAA
jgi:hypothetical protein